jgi:hypothetical protein
VQKDIESDDQDAAHSTRATKLEDFLDFDKDKNKRWRKVLMRARRAINSLNHELHVLSTLAAQRKQPGRKYIAQTQQKQTCLDSIQRNKQVCSWLPSLADTTRAAHYALPEAGCCTLGGS